MKQLLLLTVIVTLALCGCSSPNLTAYKTLGAIAVTVDTGKRAFYDYRAKHGVTADVEAKAKAAYESYQKAMAIAEVYEKQFLAGGDKAAWENAYTAVILSGNQMLDLVRQFVPQTSKL